MIEQLFLSSAIKRFKEYKGLGDKTRRRGKARRVVVDGQVIVYGLGNMDAAERIAGLVRRFGNDADGVGAVIAADIEKAIDAVRLHHPEYLQAVFPVGLVARRTQCGRRCGGDQLQIRRRLRTQVNQILIDDAAHAVDRAIDFFDRSEFAGFEDGANQRLVDDRGGAAALGYQNSGQGRPPGAAREGLLRCQGLRAPERNEGGGPGPCLKPGKGRFWAA